MIVSGLNHYAHSSKTKISVKEVDDSLFPGEVRFEGLSGDQLEDFRVIPEDANPDNSDLFVPENNKNYETDGFYLKGMKDDNYWFKIGDGKSVLVTVTPRGYNTGLSQYSFANVTSQFNIIGNSSFFGFKPKSDPHFTSNPFNPNR